MKQIVLRSSTFLWTDSKEGLLYNTDTNAFYVFSTEDSLIASVCSQWEDLDNLYVAKVEESQATRDFEDFCKKLEELSLGAVLSSQKLALACPPRLKIKHSIETINHLEGDISIEPVLSNLMRMIVFLGGSCDKSNLWRQVIYPMVSEARMDAGRLRAFLRWCDAFSLKRVDLVITEWDSRQISSFAEELKDQKGIVRFFFAHPDPGFDNEILNDLATSGYAVTQVCLPDKDIQKATWTPGRNYQLLVRSEGEVEHWEALLEESKGVNYDFKPVADNNLDFFRENIFLSEEEILSQKLSPKDIFRHQALNVNQFGTFVVFPDGTIHPAADAPSIGTLEDSVHQTIIRELEENYAWRQTRRLMESCKDCLYHDLCPSPSVYERALGVPGCTCWR